jgi:hypothetical protein
MNAATSTLSASPRSASLLDLLVLTSLVYRGVRQRSSGLCVAEINDQNTCLKVQIGRFHLADQALFTYEVENVQLHGSDCGELKF